MDDGKATLERGSECLQSSISLLQPITKPFESKIK